MAEQFDLSDYILNQDMTAIVSKEVLDKFSYDEIINGLSPGKSWSIVNFSSNGEDVMLTFRNDDHADRLL